MLTKEQITSVKGLGFLQNRGTDMFSGRIVAPGTVFTSQNFTDLAELSNKYGNGKLIATSRLSIEVPGIKFENIEPAIKFAEEKGLYFGGTGPKVRPITACKGTTCIFGNCDTHAIAKTVHEAFYLGWSDVKLPHKFKIGVGGCPNSCMKPSLNDFGIEGHKKPVFNKDVCHGCKKCIVEAGCPVNAAVVTDGKLFIDAEKCISCGRCVGKCPFNAIDENSETVYKIFVGGTWGKTTKMGTPLSIMVTENKITSILEKALLWYKENGIAKERFAKTIERLGIDELEKALFSDDILLRKDSILSSPIKEHE